ncbi:hypothetical protein E2C01_017618 [Portunus trituberculatus]|uniref:Uncharacterized protein n=1 Tax=Portunus trituberculatus TaxID=210409 RepID=A0A5B7DTC9_PORTR|nr:hypothetical protein [Portunus trituberculatus]
MNQTRVKHLPGNPFTLGSGVQDCSRRPHVWSEPAMQMQLRSSMGEECMQLASLGEDVLASLVERKEGFQNN